MTKVKICGITNLEDALVAASSGADALGFNFYERSPRSISPEKAGEISAKLPRVVMKVGVFVNDSIDNIISINKAAVLDAVQLHGDENVEFVRKLKSRTGAKIIKAFRVGPDFLSSTIADLEVDAVLLDAYSPDRYGGTGDRFDWSTAKAVKQFASELYLAGGLTPNNVAKAIRTVRPYAVDVASGVESEPRKKDPKKLETFIRNAKGA